MTSTKHKTKYLKNIKRCQNTSKHKTVLTCIKKRVYIVYGRYALIKFKLGSAEIDEGAKHLLKICELVREYNKREKQAPLREPDLLMVITGGNMAYTREDGVKVIPIACMKD